MSRSKAGLIQPYSSHCPSCKVDGLRCQQQPCRGQGCTALALG